MISAFTKARISATDLRGSGEVIERLRWVIGIRWTVVAALLLVGLLGTRLSNNDSGQSNWHIALAAIVALLNLVFLVVTWQPRLAVSNLGQTLRFVQIPADLLVFTAIIHFSGGVTGPVFVLYFLYIFVGLAILPPAGAYFVAGTAALLYAALAVLEVFWMQPSQQSAGVGRLPAAPSGLTYLGYVLTVSAALMIISYVANYFAGLLTHNESTIREQLDELNALYDFTRTTSHTYNSGEITSTLVSSALNTEQADSCSLILFDEQGDSRFAATKGFTEEQTEAYKNSRLNRDHPVLHNLLREGRGVFAPDVEQTEGLRSLLIRPTTRSFYAVPMWREETLAGILNLSFDRKYVMPIGHWNMLVAMTQQAALALERARLFNEAQRAARESAGLYQIGLVATSSLNIEEVLRLIFEQVDRVLHPDTFYIALYKEELGELRYDIFVENGHNLPPFRAHLDNVGVASWVIRNREPIFIRDWNVEREQMPFEANVVGSQTCSSISVPLVAKDKIVGVMSAQALKPHAFDEHNLRLLTSIANQAALALENARLHATVNEQAQRDSLTGAYNHGAFLEKADQALAEARDNHTSVALVMLDVDKFKQYNDTYGHLVGNDVLRSVVASIQGHVKSTDLVGRWGGEEFTILLPDVTRGQARMITERIRQTVACNVMGEIEGKSIPSPTVSQGIAFFPEDAQNVEEMIGKADTALYQAKDLGRNHIVEWISLNSALSSASPSVLQHS